MTTNFWTRAAPTRWSRRTLLGTAGSAAAGAAGIALVGCGDDDDQKDSSPTPGTGESPAAEQPRRGGKLTFSFGFEMPNHDVFGSTNGGMWLAAPGIVYSRLLRDKTGPDVPSLTTILEGDLAESWEQPDDMTYVFKLRQGVKFHNVEPVNGRELTAEDVVYSTQKQLQSATKGFLPELSEVAAVDKYTVRMRTPRPEADALLGLTSSPNQIVAREAVELRGDLKDGPSIGTGPWMFDSWTPNQTFVVVRNPNYFRNGRPYADKLEFPRITDPSTQKAAFRTKQVLRFGGVLDDIKPLREDFPDLVFTESSSWTATFFLAKVDGQTRDPRIRQAIWKGMNRPQAIDAIFGGKAQLLVGPGLPGLDWALPEREMQQVMGHDPKEAAKLLSAAGQSSITLDSTIAQISVPQRSLFELFQADLKEVGININGQLVDVNKYVSHLQNGDFKELSWGAQSFLTPTSDLRNRWKTGGAWNGPGLSDPELDAMIDKQATLVGDEPGRRKLFLDIQRRIVESASFIQGLAPAGGFSLQLTWPELRNYNQPSDSFENAHYEGMWLAS